MGINLKEARTETEKIIGRGSGFVAVEIPFTPRAKRVLELSLEEARQLGGQKPGSTLGFHAIFIGREQTLSFLSTLLLHELSQSLGRAWKCKCATMLIFL